MLRAKQAGQISAARKYDLLTVIGTHGLATGKAAQRLALRLICLITARYNWQTDELSMGQAEIARLWCVDLRTVKRELAVLRARGWLVEKRPPARGRVTVYELGQDRILQDTRAVWPNIGSDLESRLDTETTASPDLSSPTDTNVVPFPSARQDDLWNKARRLLSTEQPTIYAAWIDALEVDSVSPDELCLRAPSRFHATYVQTHLAPVIAQAVQRCDQSVHSVRLC